MKHDDRHLELSSKFIEMGNALIKEGKKNKDYMTHQSGTFLVLIGSLFFSEEDIVLFGQFCSMFSAKQILENMEKTKSDMTEFLKNKTNNESYDDFIKRINKLREDNGHTPIG
jgi:hypothetical protein